MIYLVEDKTSRRNDYGWTDDKISSMSDTITVVENASVLINLMEYIKNDGNVILYHESFTRVENDENTKIVNNFLEDLENSSGVLIAYFSGSKTERKCDGHICNLNYDPMYTNLDAYIRHAKKGQADFKYLMFGDYPEIEDYLRQLLVDVNNKNIDIPKIESERKLLVYRTYDEPIEFPVTTANIKDDCDSSCKDEDLIALVKEQKDVKYDAIYIPLCMGETLSDFLGLRLALLFRLVDTVNKFTHIFIYGVANYSLFISNECAEVLKMKGVTYVNANCQYIINSLRIIRRINESDYRLGLKKIHLNVPTNIGDNHSVANKWARYRWSIALNDKDDAIEKNNMEIDSSLYFSYLKALYPPSSISGIDNQLLKIEDSESKQKLKVLYVDDEADDGWNELLCYIFYDVNGIKNYEYIGNDIKSKSQEEIIQYVMSKVKEGEINLVILDLRLSPKDFVSADIKDITGYKLLKSIKLYNRGIQVLMLSATNKVWNLQALQNAEVNGFIVKESPENSVDSNFTEESLKHFVNILNHCNDRIFLKEIWPYIKRLKNKVNNLLRFQDIKQEYGDNLLTLLSMTEDHLFATNNDHYLDSSFITLFRIVELTANEWIKSKWTGSSRYYSFDNGDPVYFFNDNNTRPSYEYKPNANQLPNNLKIANILYRVGSYSKNIQKLVEKRNKYTHPNNNLAYFTIEDLKNMLSIVESIIMNLESV